MGKPAGIRTARKHVKNRRNQVWADKDYKKAHLGTRWKANPFGGASHAKVSRVLFHPVIVLMMINSTGSASEK